MAKLFHDDVMHDGSQSKYSTSLTLYRKRVNMGFSLNTNRIKHGFYH